MVFEAVTEAGKKRGPNPSCFPLPLLMRKPKTLPLQKVH